MTSERRPAFGAGIHLPGVAGRINPQAGPPLGVLGAPRRTMLSATPYLQAEWRPLLTLVGIGGTLLFVSSLLYFLNLVLTLVASRAPAPDFPQFAEVLSGADHAPIILDRWRPWLALAAVLIVIACGPTVAC